MEKYNWDTYRWSRGMSLLTLAHLFCDLNSISVREFCRHFSSESPKGEAKPNELVDSAESSLNAELLAQRLGPERIHHDELFANYYRVTDIEGEIERKFRYCSMCLRKGYHFAFQQLSWLSHCPVHEQPIFDHCGCKKRPGFVLNQVSRPPGQLCGCGELQLGKDCNFTSIESSRLEAFLAQLQVLRDNLAMGLCSIRTSYSQPDAKEILDTYKLIRHVFSGLTLFPRHFGGSPNVEVRWLKFLQEDPLSVIDRLFEQYFSETGAKGHWDAAETRRHCDIVGMLELQLLGRDARCAASSVFQKNATEDKLDDATLTYAIAVTTMRVLEEAHKLEMPIRRGHEPKFQDVVKAYGSPTCLLWTPDDTPVTPQVFWLADRHHDSPSKLPWVDDLARFYLKHILMKRFTPNVVGRKLEEAEESRARCLRFAFPGGSSAGPAQPDLFGDLGVPHAPVSSP